MYGWGGDTRDWKGSKRYDYGSARAKYDKAATSAGLVGASARTYDRRKEPDASLTEALGKTISSDSENPIVVAVDVTGSMSSWPGEIFDRLPLLYQTLAKYRPDTELAFAAIGDATSDRFPLQVTSFTKDIKELEKNLKALGCEGNGGGQIKESYELFGYFMLHHCNTPKAKSPFLLIYGDEAFYSYVNSVQVKHYIGDDLESNLSSKDMWSGLLQKFNLNFLQKPYGSDGNKSTTDEVKKVWANGIGLQRIIELPFKIEKEGGSTMPGYQRAVDIGMGLIAKNWGEYKDFDLSLDARHKDASVKASVHKSLRHIDADPVTTSVTKTSNKGSRLTKPLI